jgi:DNA-directed RNA polymerase beta' subunit
MQHTLDEGLNVHIPSYNNPVLDEYNTQDHLSDLKNRVMKQAYQRIKSSSRFVDPVLSGAKGDFFNISQISSILGQQTVSGKRVIPTIDYNRRTLPHQKYESSTKFSYINSGFIRRSFFAGLSATEYFYHSMSAREGIIDTSMKTAVTGYMSRKIIKVCEDIHIDHMGSVRGPNGMLLNTLYGVDGMTPISPFPNK